MKAKRIIVVTLLIISVIFGATPAMADFEWYVCTVQESGVAGSHQTLIRITDINGAFTSKWFLSWPDRGKEQLAVALTAISNNARVRVMADIDEGRILNMYLMSE